jgi:hypothetical protein
LRPGILLIKAIFLKNKNVEFSNKNNNKKLTGVWLLEREDDDGDGDGDDVEAE